jgi:hypothetical protein
MNFDSDTARVLPRNRLVNKCIIIAGCAKTFTVRRHHKRLCSISTVHATEQPCLTDIPAKRRVALLLFVNISHCDNL